MNAQEIFYAIGSIAFLLLSAFIVFFFFVLYQTGKAVQASLRELKSAVQGAQGSLSALAKGWGRVTMAGVIFRILRTFILRR